MANSEHLEILRSGRAAWNTWREEKPTVRPDLRNADLSGSSLDFVDLTASDLSGADLRGSNLNRTSLKCADLQFANFQGARGLERIARSGARNLLLAHYSSNELEALELNCNHSEFLEAKRFPYERRGLDFTNANLGGFDLSNSVLTDCTFEGANLSATKLIKADLRWSTFERANLTGADLCRASLVYCNLRNASMRSAIMRGADIRIADFEGADLHGADLRSVIFAWRTVEPDLFRSRNYIFIYCSSALADELNLRPDPNGQKHGGPTGERVALDVREEPDATEREQDADHNERLAGKSFAGYDLSGQAMDGIDLSGWDLSKTRCERTNFRNTNLHACRLDGAVLVEAYLNNAHLGAASLNGARLQRAILDGADLRHAKSLAANFDAADLTNANFSFADLSGATLAETTAHNTLFFGANLSACNLRGTKLNDADLTEAILDDANLAKSVLVRAKLIRSKLCRIKTVGAEFTGSDLSQANVQGADFQGAIDLDPEAIRKTCATRLALYDYEFLLKLPEFPDPDKHNDRIRSKNFTDLNFAGCNLGSADLTGLVLEGVVLADAVLDRAQLTGARLGRAVLDRASLKYADLCAADLTSASLIKASLDESRMDKAVLRNATFRMGSLINVTMSDADVSVAVFRDAVLEGADMETVQGLYSDQLAGTNINAAKLPRDLGEFSALKNIEGITTSARGLVLAEVLVCAYAALQVVSLKDGDLLANRSILSSPLLDMRAPVLFFCFGCPLVLLAIYVWTHFYLQHLWEELAQLPAIFQDSRPLYKKVYPWFLNSFVSAHFPILRKDRPLLTHIQILCSVAITWWMVPATVLLLWARYLGCHDKFGSGLQLGVLAIAISMAVFLQRLAGATLHGDKRRPLKLHVPNAGQLKILGIVWLVILGLAVFSWGAMNSCGLAGDTDGSFLTRFCISASLADAEVSSKNAGWRGAEEALVTGASLASRNLQRAIGNRAFLARADLRHAKLEGAHFDAADFRWADLSDAHLEHAHLAGADFRGANLRGAHLTGALVQGADLRGAHLDGVIGLTRAQLDLAITDSIAK
jgi:uncharacterized protein YjbI with pentapeptide repeats